MMTWDEYIGWGAGSTIQTSAAKGLMTYGLEDDEYLRLHQIVDAATQMMRKQHTFDLSEYIGPQGRQGPAGPRGLPGLPGIGTNYVPQEVIPSDPGAPPVRIYHPNNQPTDPFADILTLWSQVASVVVFPDSQVTCTGWARFQNDSAGARTLTLWLMYRDYTQGEPTGGDVNGPENATLISDYVSKSIASGGEELIRVRGYVEPALYGYVDLYAHIDSFSGADVRAVGNHYGISGRGVFPR